MVGSNISPLLIIIGSQLLFTGSDFLGRYLMGRQGFTMSAFVSGWVLCYIVLRVIATFGQLYVFAHLELGRTMALFGAVSIVLANVLGYLFLGELLSTAAYAGVSLAILAMLVLVLR